MSTTVLNNCQSFNYKDFVLYQEQLHVSGIYFIKNRINNKLYIGQSIDIYTRLRNHIHSPGPCSIIDSSLQKYTLDVFDVMWLACPIDQLDELEQKYIREYDTLYPNGYNLTKGGESSYGSDNPASVLTEDEVIIMRSLYTKYERNIIINIFPQYSERLIVSILSGQNWKVLPVYKKRGHAWSFPLNYNKEAFLLQVDQIIDYYTKVINDTLKNIKHMKGVRNINV